MTLVRRTTRDELSSTLRIAVMRLARRLRQEKSDNETTLTQLSALATLERHGPLTLGDLAAHERVQPPSMSRVVAALVERGLATRTPHPTDGRQQLVAVSDHGHEMLDQQRRRREAWLSHRLAGLTAHERKTLAEAAAILERLAAQ
jgi:DNA-binding MarR family transcriptional regulator